MHSRRRHAVGRGTEHAAPGTSSGTEHVGTREAAGLDRHSDRSAAFQGGCAFGRNIGSKAASRPNCSSGSAYDSVRGPVDVPNESRAAHRPRSVSTTVISAAACEQCARGGIHDARLASASTHASAARRQDLVARTHRRRRRPPRSSKTTRRGEHVVARPPVPHHHLRGAPCLQSHFNEHGQRLPVHYGDGVNGRP